MDATHLVDRVRTFVMPALALAAAIAAPIGVYVGFHHVVRSRVFLVDEVVVEGLVELDRDALLAAAALDRPRNVLTCRPARIEDAIADLPWVREVDARVSLEGRIHIEVREATAWGIVALDDLVLVDADGVRIRPWLPTDDPALPLVVGVGQGDDVDPLAFADARRAVEAWTERFDADGTRLRELHRHPVHGYRVVREDGVEVRLGADQLDARLARVAEVDAVLREESQVATRILLEGDDLQRVNVRLADATTGEW